MFFKYFLNVITYFWLDKVKGDVKTNSTTYHTAILNLEITLKWFWKQSPDYCATVHKLEFLFCARKITKKRKTAKKSCAEQFSYSPENRCSPLLVCSIVFLTLALLHFPLRKFGNRPFLSFTRLANGSIYINFKANGSFGNKYFSYVGDICSTDDRATESIRQIAVVHFFKNPGAACFDRSPVSSCFVLW